MNALGNKPVATSARNPTTSHPTAAFLLVTPTELAHLLQARATHLAQAPTTMIGQRMSAPFNQSLPNQSNLVALIPTTINHLQHQAPLTQSIPNKSTENSLRKKHKKAALSRTKTSPLNLTLYALISARWLWIVRDKI